MNQNRFSDLFGGRQHETRKTTVSLRGFTTNPLGGSVTPEQISMYQAAYQQALIDSEEAEFPDAECWN